MPNRSCLTSQPSPGISPFKGYLSFCCPTLLAPPGPMAYHIIMHLNRISHPGTINHFIIYHHLEYILLIGDFNPKLKNISQPTNHLVRLPTSLSFSSMIHAETNNTTTTAVGATALNEHRKAGPPLRPLTLGHLRRTKKSLKIFERWATRRFRADAVPSGPDKYFKKLLELIGIYDPFSWLTKSCDGGWRCLVIAGEAAW